MYRLINNGTYNTGQPKVGVHAERAVREGECVCVRLCFLVCRLRAERAEREREREREMQAYPAAEYEM